MCLLPASEILPPQLSRTVTWQYEICLEEVTQDNNGMIIKTMTFLQRYTSTDFFFLGKRKAMQNALSREDTGPGYSIISCQSKAFLGIFLPTHSKTRKKCI